MLQASARGPWQSQSSIKLWSLYAISKQRNVTSDYSLRQHDRKRELVIEILMRCWTQNTVAARRVPAYTSAINERGLGHINIVAGDNVSRVAIYQRRGLTANELCIVTQSITPRL